MTLSKYRIPTLLVAVVASTSNCLAAELAYIALPHEVMTFDMSGSLLNSFSTVDRVEDIAVNSLGEMYVLTLSVQEGNFVSIIEKFDPGGNSLGEIVTDISSDTHLLGLVLGADQNLYVGRNGAIDTIERYTQTGNPLGTFATISTPVPGAPFAIVFDSSENMYVPDHDLIEKFDTSGQSLGTFAMIDPSLSFSFDLDIDSLDNLYAAILDDRIQIFDSSGISLQILDPQIDIRSIALDSDDILYVAGDGSGGTLGSVKTFLSDGTPLGTFVSGLSGEPIDMKFATIVPEPIILALVDIKPGSFPNPVNPKSKGVLSVAILGTADFNVNDVNIDTLLFGDPLLIDNGGTAVSPLRSSLVDISGDGFLDLTLKFSTRDLVEFGALGSDTIEGILIGLLKDSTPFEGMDSIRLVPPNGSHGNSLQISSVPEPTTLALVALGLLGIGWRRRKRA